MSDLDQQIENLKKRLKQKQELKRREEARDRAKQQRELDRRNLLLGRALSQAGQADYFQSLRGVLGQRKSELTDLSGKDYEILMRYFDELIGKR